jgi:crotonobetainyl-CoA:carnitine CoA-transferase CaiB-like acyl-CoA transferase
MTGPMDGIRIVDLSIHFSGPFGTVMLADQGAEVIKVEQPGTGDGTRHSAPIRGGLSAMFAAINRNKQSIALDIAKAEGKAVLRDLIAGADVLVQNSRPGVMDRLGFGYDAVKAINPHLIYVSISGFGPEGPYADRRAYDPTIQAASGLADIQADPATGEMRMVQMSVCDKLTGLLVAQAIASAIAGRERDPDRAGRHVEIAMLDAAVWFLWPDGMFNHAFIGDNPVTAPSVVEHYRVRRTQGGFLIVAMISQAEFAAVCRVLGCPEIIDDPRFATVTDRYHNMGAANDIMAPLFERRDRDELFDALLAADVPVTKVNDRAAVLADPQLRYRGTFIESEHPKAGLMRQVRHPIDFGDTLPLEPAQLLGEGSRKVLEGLDYSAEQIETLFEQGVVA